MSFLLFHLEYSRLHCTFTISFKNLIHVQDKIKSSRQLNRLTSIMIRKGIKKLHLGSGSNDKEN